MIYKATKWSNADINKMLDNALNLLPTARQLWRQAMTESRAARAISKPTERALLLYSTWMPARHEAELNNLYNEVIDLPTWQTNVANLMIVEWLTAYFGQHKKWPSDVGQLSDYHEVIIEQLAFVQNWAIELEGDLKE